MGQLIIIIIAAIALTLIWIDQAMGNAMPIDKNGEPMKIIKIDGKAPGIHHSIEPDVKIKNPGILHTYWMRERNITSKHIHSK